MNAHTDTQLDTYLDRIVNHIQQLRHLDLTTEAAVEQAMNQSQQVMGTLAMFRRQLQRVEPNTVPMMLQAA